MGFCFISLSGAEILLIGGKRITFPLQNIHSIALLLLL